MRIDHSEVEFPGNQEDDSTDGGQSREAVGLARLRPGDDPGGADRTPVPDQSRVLGNIGKSGSR